MAGLHFDITGDNANFLRKLDEARNGVRSTSKQIEESGVSIEQMFGRLAKGATAFGAGITAKEIVSNIVRVRGEFQQLEVAFNTMLGSEQKAAALMSQLVKTAATTPFDLQSVAQGAKQLLAYGGNVENVNEDLVRLGNIASGLSQPLNDLVYLYGTTMTQGRLYTQDFNQFTGRGIPMIKELAKQFNVAESEVKGLVEAGKVGFPEVQKVIQSLTNEGGMFFNLMEKQSKTITGQISNIEDSIATMYNNIGKQSEGLINDALSGVSYLIENYEQVGKAVLELAAVYGAYKAVLISVAAYQGFATGITYSAEIAELSKLIPLKKQSTNEDVIASVASGKLTQVKADQVIALRAEIAAKIQSLQATEAQTKAEYASAMSIYKSATQRMLVAKQNMAIAQSQMSIAIKSGTADEIAAAKKNTQTVSLELNNAAIAKNSAHKTLNIASTNKKAASDAVSSFQTGVNTAVQNANTTSTNILTVAKTRLAAASRALGLSMLANPYVLVTAAIVGLGYAIYKVVTAETDVEEAIRTTNEALEAQKKHYDDLKSKSSELSGILTNESKSIEERFIAYRQLQRLMPNVFKDMDFEITKRLSNADAIKLETDEILRQQRIGLKTKVVMSQQKIQGLENSIIKTNNIGGYTGALKEGLDAAKQELKIYQKALKDFEDAKQESEKSKNQPIIQNKSYWESQKKDAQTKLDALTDIEAVGAKGVALKQKIAGYDKKINAFSTNTSKQDNQVKKLLQQQEKYNLLLDKQKLERIRAEEDLQMQVSQSKNDTMSDGFNKEQEQRDLNNKKEIQSLNRQKEDAIRAIIQAEKEKFDAQEDVKAQQRKGYVKQYFDASTVDTSKTGSLWDKIIRNIETKQVLDEWQKREDSMNEYLLKYGTFSQKKEAIDKKYQDAINQETDIGSKSILQKEWNKALSSLDMDKLKQEINWELIFGDLSKVSKKSLSEVKQQLKTFKSSSEYKDMTVDQKKVIDDALNNIQTTLIDKGGLLGDLPEQLDALRIAQKELNEAQKEYNDAIKSGTDAEKEAAIKKKNNAEKNVQNAEVNVTKSADKTSRNLITLADTITELGSTSEMSLSQIGSLASGLIDTFTDAGSKIGGIVGAAFSLLDAIDKQGIDGFVANVFSSVFKAAGSIWDTITFGAFSKITGSGESDKNLERDIEYLTQSNQDLKNSLDNLSEKMDKASVADANDIYSVQKENILKQEANLREAMQRSGAAYSNGFWGIAGSHSSNNKIDTGLSASEWSRISEIVGKSISNAGQFFQLSSEQMAKLAEEDTSLYSKIKDLANNGYRDAAQYMDEYITYYKQLEELENAYNEKLTNTSFADVRNDFKNTLLDMESDVEDFTDNFEKMMQNAIVESLMTKKYDALIQGWYEEFAKAMEGDSKIDESEQKKLQDRWNSITNQALAERDALKDAMGWEIDKSTSQDSTKRGFGTEMTHEDAGELSGRFTALQISNEEIKNSMLSMLVSVSLLSVSVNSNGITLVEIRNLMISSNSYLEDIAKYTKELIGFKQTIHNIENSAKAMAGK